MLIRNESTEVCWNESRIRIMNDNVVIDRSMKL
jgi:hypothetical protein